MKNNMNPQNSESRPNDKLAGIIFISIPEKLQEHFGDLVIDPNRLLPVETGGEADKWDISELSWEMIIAGMLKILAFQPDHEDVTYYRDFIRAVKPELTRELTEAAIIKTRNHDYDLAEEIFRALVGLEPDNCRFLLNLALLFEERSGVYAKLDNTELQEQNEEAAFVWYRRALSLDEIVPEAYLYAGYFFLRQNSFDMARSNFTSYLEEGTDPEQKTKLKAILSEIEGQNLQDNLFKEAYDFIRLEREEAGIAKITEFLDKNPTVWNGWFILGWAKRRIKAFAEARDAFLKAIEHGGANSDTLNELAICQMELGEFGASRTTLEKALGLDPENVKIISNLGILALKQEQRGEAEAFFRTVLEYEPEDPIATQYLAHLERE